MSSSTLLGLWYAILAWVINNLFYCWFYQAWTNPFDGYVSRYEFWDSADPRVSRILSFHLCTKLLWISSLYHSFLAKVPESIITAKSPYTGTELIWINLLIRFGCWTMWVVVVTDLQVIRYQGLLCFLVQPAGKRSLLDFLQSSLGVELGIALPVHSLLVDFSRLRWWVLRYFAEYKDTGKWQQTYHDCDSVSQILMIGILYLIQSTI